MNSLLGKIGRFMYALPFGVFGIMHLMSGPEMAGYIPEFIPGGAFWVYLTGLAHLAACVSILIEKKTRLACLLLGIMLLVFVLTIHLPGVMGGGEGATSAMSNMLKDLALAGGAWVLGGKYEDGAGATASPSME